MFSVFCFVRDAVTEVVITTEAQNRIVLVVENHFQVRLKHGQCYFWIET